MKNIIKTVIIMLTSVSLFASANAGELTVTGTAKATINSVTGHSNGGKGLGVANEFNLGANGELDNGYTWNYTVAMDPGAAGAQFNDDTILSVASPFGTVGIFISAGGLDLEDGASQSVYGRPTDVGDPSATVDNLTTDGDNTIQYHTPSGLLPYGIAAKFSYAPSASDAQGAAANATAALEGTGGLNSRTGVQIKAAPIDGLNIGISTVQTSVTYGASGVTQEPASYAAMATYAYGPVVVGYSVAENEPGIQAHAVATIDKYEQTNASIAFAVNDSLSISVERENSKASAVAAATATIDQESTAVQAAYTMGGMTLAVSQGKYDNIGYNTNQEATQTLLAVTMAF
jgi:hypothetical protein